MWWRLLHKTVELDHVGLCWDGDLVRAPNQRAWRARGFRGTDWQAVRAPEAVANRVNTYRVLLTRARRQTILWVPQGSTLDRTRDPSVLDAVAAFLLACGARPLAPLPPAAPVMSERLL